MLCRTCWRPMNSWSTQASPSLVSPDAGARAVSSGCPKFLAKTSDSSCDAVGHQVPQGFLTAWKAFGTHLSGRIGARLTSGERSEEPCEPSGTRYETTTWPYGFWRMSSSGWILSFDPGSLQLSHIMTSTMTSSWSCPTDAWQSSTLKRPVLETQCWTLETSSPT